MLLLTLDTRTPPHHLSRECHTTHTALRQNDNDNDNDDQTTKDHVPLVRDRLHPQALHRCTTNPTYGTVVHNVLSYRTDSSDISATYLRRWINHTVSIPVPYGVSSREAGCSLRVAPPSRVQGSYHHHHLSALKADGDTGPLFALRGEGALSLGLFRPPSTPISNGSSRLLCWDLRPS